MVPDMSIVKAILEDKSELEKLSYSEFLFPFKD